MAKVIGSPALIGAVGNQPKIAQEFVGLVNTGDSNVSITRLESPPGWKGPVRTSAGDEYLIILTGMLQVEHADGVDELEAGQGMHILPGDEVILSTPGPHATDYISVCLPAFKRPKPFGKPL